MMSKCKTMSKLIVKKTGAFFKFTIILLVFSLFLLASGALFVSRQYVDWDKNFISNDKAHIIIVTKAQVNEPLLFKDYKTLKKLTNKFSKTEINTEYMLECGFYHENYGDIFIHSINGQSKMLLGLDQADRTASYSNVIINQSVDLQIPVVDVKTGGFASSKSVSTTINNINLVGKNPIIYLFEETNDMELYVPFEQYKNIVSTMFSTDWNEFVQKYDESNPFDMNMIKSYYVYVDDINDVDRCADLLNKNNYSVSYAIKAFDNVSDSIKATEMIIALFTIILYIISYVLIYISMKSYFRLQSRDIGILKQMGFSKKSLSTIYFGIVKKPLIGTIALLVIYIIGIGILFVKNIFLITIVLFIMLLLCIIIFITLKYSVEKVIAKPILQLLKTKEIE